MNRHAPVAVGDVQSLRHFEEVGMASDHTRSIAERARRIYDERLRADLESQHSGDSFRANSLDTAADAAPGAHLARQPLVLRVGHAAALHLGGAWS